MPGRLAMGLPPSGPVQLGPYVAVPLRSLRSLRGPHSNLGRSPTMGTISLASIRSLRPDMDEPPHRFQNTPVRARDAPCLVALPRPPLPRVTLATSARSRFAGHPADDAGRQHALISLRCSAHRHVRRRPRLAAAHEAEAAHAGPDPRCRARAARHRVPREHSLADERDARSAGRARVPLPSARLDRLDRLRASPELEHELCQAPLSPTPKARVRALVRSAEEGDGRGAAAHGDGARALAPALARRV